MGGVSLLVGTRKQLPTPRLVSATVCVLWSTCVSVERLLWLWDKMVLEVGSPESHLVNLLGIKKKILFCAKTPLELVLDYRARMRKACNWPQLHDDDSYCCCFPRSVDRHLFSQLSGA